MVRLVPLLALSCVLAGCPKSAGTPAAAPAIPEDATFVFAWPDAIEGVRSATKITTRTLGERELRQEIHTTEDQRVERTEQGWKVHSANGKFHPPDGMAVDPAIEALAAVPLAFLVDTDGRFDGLDDARGWEQRARKAMLGGAEEGDVVAKVMADTAVQPRALEGVLADDWFAHAELWVGKPAAPGKTGQMPGTAPTGQPTDQVTDWRIDGPVPCGEDGPVTCVEATARMHRTPAMLERETEGLLKAWLRDRPAPERAVVDYAIGEVVVTVVLEPDTLLPWRYTRSQTAVSEAKVDDTMVPLATSLEKTVTWGWRRSGEEG